MSHEKVGAMDQYTVLARASSGSAQNFYVSEFFLREPKKSKYDATLILGVAMNHYSTSQDIINSMPWRGLTKKSKSISHMAIQRVVGSLEQPQSVTNAYTEIQVGVSLVDRGRKTMLDLWQEGVIGFFWATNWYFANTVDPQIQNKLEVWNGAALLDMNDYLYGAVHNRQVGAMWNTPTTYKYDLLPCRPPLFFYHMSGNYGDDLHSAYGRIQIMAKVRFLASEKSLEFGE